MKQEYSRSEAAVLHSYLASAADGKVLEPP